MVCHSATFKVFRLDQNQSNLKVCTSRPVSYTWFNVFTHDHFGFIFCADGRSRTYNFNHHWHQITKYTKFYSTGSRWADFRIGDFVKRLSQTSLWLLSIFRLQGPIVVFRISVYDWEARLRFLLDPLRSLFFLCSVLSLSGTFPHYHKPTIHLHTRIILMIVPYSVYFHAFYVIY